MLGYDANLLIRILPVYERAEFATHMRRNIPSMSGSGEVIFLVLALRARRSTTTRNPGGFDFTLGIRSIGAVLPELESLRKSRTSRMRLLCIAQSRGFFFRCS
jgi:hypothetical protein